MEHFKTELPYCPSEEFKPGYWYPLPVGYHQRDGDWWICNGYGIFELDKNHLEKEDRCFGDIVPVKSKAECLFIFEEALLICENHNGEKLL